MKCVRNVFAFCSVLLLLGGCLLPLGCRTAYISADGASLDAALRSASILPPPGEDWDYFTKQEHGERYVAFLKRGTSPSHHFAADVTEVDRPEGIIRPEDIGPLLLKRIVRDYFSGRKFVITREEVVTDSRFGDMCVRFVIDADDYEAPGRGDADFLKLRMWGYAFVHPSRPEVTLTIAMNERGHATELDAASEQVGEAFFSGLTLH
jgi:hypothetical protein